MPALPGKKIQISGEGGTGREPRSRQGCVRDTRRGQSPPEDTPATARGASASRPPPRKLQAKRPLQPPHRPTSGSKRQHPAPLSDTAPQGGPAPPRSAAKWRPRGCRALPSLLAVLERLRQEAALPMAGRSTVAKATAPPSVLIGRAACRNPVTALFGAAGLSDVGDWRRAAALIGGGRAEAGRGRGLL